MEFIKTFLAFIFLILLIVTVHEGGHLIAAKIFGVYCTEFSIGMGPEIYRKKNKETDFVIRCLPIGGFCSMAGESEDGIEERHNVDVPFERTLKGVARWKQIIIYLAGVTMNFILGFIIIIIALMTIQKNGVYVDFLTALKGTPKVFWNYASAIILGIVNLFKNLTSLSGILGIFSYTGEAINEGITFYLMLIALISINVGVFNLIPLPVMDGGRVLIALIEMILGRDINKEFEKKIMLICAVLLILLMAWALGLDVYRLFAKNEINILLR